MTALFCRSIFCAIALTLAAAKAIDRKTERSIRYYTWANSATNRAAANRIMKGWAEILLNALNEAKAEAVPK